MANYKIKNIVFIFILLLFLNIAPTFSNENIPRTDVVNYEEIYDSLDEANFEYIFGIDPYQADEYTVYMHSPYPLFRTGVQLVFKSKTINPGYYLLTPREKDGKTYVLFKENGRISFVIPVYKEDSVPETFYDEKIPHPKLNAFQKAKKKTTDFIGTKWGKKNQRTPIPNAYIEFDDVGDYWNMVLYYGFKKYYLVFKKA